MIGGLRVVAGGPTCVIHLLVYVCYIVLIKGYAIFFRVLKGNNQMYSSLSVGQNVQFVYFGSIIFNSNNSSRGGS